MRYVSLRFFSFITEPATSEYLLRQGGAVFIVDGALTRWYFSQVRQTRSLVRSVWRVPASPANGQGFSRLGELGGEGDVSLPAAVVLLHGLRPQGRGVTTAL